MQADLDCEAVSFMIDEHSEEPRGVSYDQSKSSL